ncbi:MULTISPECIES: LuxR family transcriptional regulator [Methylobacterium]|uniref:helix-turn-helix transcriptional regulator n=1 Tax=Methylobacterium TaxID=407 RepID=UPI0008ED22AF|nr:MULTISPECIES: LuxR family transcriptional regulator [Methylobacterium]MBZ6414972.1 LuxR family transcriptional regulator [Methylobacterium sp.]SFF52004.1 transcriptional regulator, LuxR family [Methylobacterium sp. yr596]
MLDEKLAGVLDRIAASKSVIELKGVIDLLRSEYKIANIAYHAISIPLCEEANPILILTYEDEWVKRYIERDYFTIDPIVAAGRRGFLPIDWAKVDRTSPETQKFFREAEAYHVGRQGVTLPIRGPAGERALFTLTSYLDDAEWQVRRLGFMRDFQLIGHFVHDRAVGLSGYRDKCPALSRREAQCLERIAAGRHVKQIASELDLSVSAVQLYLRSARHKLRCSSNAEAVVKAARTELL